MLSEDRKKWILLWIKNQGFTNGKILVADPERDSLFLDIKSLNINFRNVTL